MKLLFFKWHSFMRWGIERALKKLGIEYDVFEYDFADWEKDDKFYTLFGKAVKSKNYDLVLSVNFAPLVSQVCNDIGLRYVSWVYDAPLHIHDLTPLLNECNEIYFFDKIQAARFAAEGVHAFHMPLAASPEVFEQAEGMSVVTGQSSAAIGQSAAATGQSKMTGELENRTKRKYAADIALVGKLYNTELGYYESVLEPYLKGYLEGIISAQSKLYGAYIIPELVTDELLAPMNICYEKASGGKFEMGKRELEYMLACEVTGRERRIALALLSNHYDTVVYSNEKPDIKKLRFGGYVDYLAQMPQIFKNSRINLNISLKAIESGIPLRVLDIMACGGFVLTNYQIEIDEMLHPGRACVMYDSIEDMYEKAKYYLEHEDERKAIAQAGYELVKKEFNFEDKLRRML